MRRFVLIISVLLFQTGAWAVGLDRDTVKIQPVNDTLKLIEQIIKKPHSPH